MEKFFSGNEVKLLGEPQANLITSGAEADKLSLFSGTNPIILYILFFLIDFQWKRLKLTFIYIYLSKEGRQTGARSFT